MQALKDVVFDGLVRTNEKIYDLLILGKSLQQTIERRHQELPAPLHRLESRETWLTKNVFHVTEEFEVERTASHETRRPDIVLFVNGIPLAVIECKRPDIKDPIAEAISQNLRNQRDDEIPKLFLYSQLLLALSKNEAKYGTTGTAAKFWAVWKEESGHSTGPLVNTAACATNRKTGCSATGSQYVQNTASTSWRRNRVRSPAQDRALCSLCRPERLLELTFNFTFSTQAKRRLPATSSTSRVKNAIERIRERDDGRPAQGRRRLAYPGQRQVADDGHAGQGHRP